MSKRILVTAALPYANGPIHLGHMLEHTQVDVFVRGHRLAGNDAIFLCADDTHGTAIEVNAAKRGITPEELVRQSAEQHVRDFKDFLVHHDHYGSTNSDTNRRWAETFYEKARAAGHIFQKDVEQMFDHKAGRFLPDRYIKGTCPVCKSPDQYGDSCEKCGRTYDPRDLIDPKSVLTGEKPVSRNSIHYFYDLPKNEAPLRAWLDSAGSVQGEVRNFAETWLKEGLKPWDISRDGPYFGFRIPGEKDKYFYVWLDAPIGYVSATDEWCARSGRKLEEFWGKDSTAELYHFIGKDILYFHILFWPALLHDAGFRKPDAVHAHGMLTANGEKLSKSRGTFINARTYLDQLPPELFRYYLCSKFSPRLEDLDLNFDDFIGRVNGELVNNLTNLFSRSMQIVTGKLGGRIPRLADVTDAAARDVVLAFERDGLPEVGRLYTEREYGLAIRKVLDLSDYVNKYIQDKAPWALLKTDPAAAAQVLSIALNAGKLVAVAMHPVLPRFADLVARMFKLHDGPGEWRPLIARDGKADLGGETEYGPFVRLFERVEKKHIESLVAATHAEAGAAPPVTTPTTTAAAAAPPKKKKEEKKGEAEPPALIGIEDFGKLDLRVGLVKEANLVEGADKLLRLTVDLGPLGMKNVFAGIRKSYAPADMVGKRVVVLANLAPRQMKFGLSEAMVLAADDGELCRVIQPAGDVAPGNKVR
ncbi:MAG: methionine--tRNA ligase [Deltaproteobacteria bacterium]|nr:methionine--tRNA ligase [Deltaproteobacteria bacterium]